MSETGATTQVERLLTQKEVAELYTPERTVEGWRYRGGGPKYVTFGRRVLYKAASVQAFIDGHEHGDDA